MIPLLMPHAGKHRRPRPMVRYTPWLRVRRMFLSLLPARRVTLLPDLIELPATTGQLAAVHPREHLGPERPTTLQRPDGQIVIDEHHHVEVYPWAPAQQPGYPAPTEEWRADDTRYDLRIARPYVPEPTNEETRELYYREPPALNPLLAASAPVYGQAPVADVLAAEAAPPFPYNPDYDNCAGTAGCGSERVFYKWYGMEQTACPRCWVNMFGGEPDPSSVHQAHAALDAMESDLARGLLT